MVHASWPFIKLVESGDRGSVSIFLLGAEFWDFSEMAEQWISLYIPKSLIFFYGPETVIFWINLFSFRCCRLWWHWSGYSFNVFRYCLYTDFYFVRLFIFFGLLVILRRYTRLPNISSIIKVLTCIFLLSVCIYCHSNVKTLLFYFHWFCV